MLVGDKVGSVHVWRLVDHEPKLINVQENALEVERHDLFIETKISSALCIFKDDVEIIVPINTEVFLLANGQNQIKVWNVKLNTIEQIRVRDYV